MQATDGNTAALNQYEHKQSLATEAHEQALRMQSVHRVDPVQKELEDLKRNCDAHTSVAESLLDNSAIQSFLEVIINEPENVEVLKIFRDIALGLMRVDAELNIENQGGLYAEDVEHNINVRDSLKNLEAYREELI